MPMYGDTLLLLGFSGIVLSVILFVVFIVVFQARKKKISRQLEEEYGKEEGMH